MAKGELIGELAKFSKELSDAPKHLKIMMLLPVAIVTGSGFAVWRPGKRQQPLVELGFSLC